VDPKEPITQNLWFGSKRGSLQWVVQQCFGLRNVQLFLVSSELKSCYLLQASQDKRDNRNRIIPGSALVSDPQAFFFFNEYCCEVSEVKPALTEEQIWTNLGKTPSGIVTVPVPPVTTPAGFAENAPTIT
jgi:hypothetical protein